MDSNIDIYMRLHSGWNREEDGKANGTRTSGQIARHVTCCLDSCQLLLMNVIRFGQPSERVGPRHSYSSQNTFTINDNNINIIRIINKSIIVIITIIAIKYLNV